MCNLLFVKHLQPWTNPCTQPVPSSALTWPWGCRWRPGYLRGGESPSVRTFTHSKHQQHSFLVSFATERERTDRRINLLAKAPLLLSHQKLLPHTERVPRNQVAVLTKPTRSLHQILELKHLLISLLGSRYQSLNTCAKDTNQRDDDEDGCTAACGRVSLR